MPHEDIENLEKHLEPLTKIIIEMLNEAVNARRNCGIEQIWAEDEEYYEGVDDFNRSIDSYMKTRSTSGNLMAKSVDEDRCSAFFNITRQFVDSAAARSADILLPSNDWNFKIKPTPIPDIGDVVTILNEIGQPMESTQERDAKEAKLRAEKAETKIKDWLVEGGYKKEFRKVLENAAKVGTGILKGAVPVLQKHFKRTKEGLLVKTEIVPASKAVSHWDFFPDPTCGENIHDGAYVFERMYMSSKQLAALKEDPSYFTDAVNRVLREGVKQSQYESSSRGMYHEEDRFEVWYFYGEVKLEAFTTIDSSKEESLSTETVPMIITLVNDTIIKGIPSPIPNGRFPFDVMVWQRQEGTPFGIGVARQGRSAQKMVLSALRALMDNMGLSAIPMIALARYAIDPADGNYELRPGKMWLLKESAGIRNINEAIQALVIPTLQRELQEIVQLGMQLMESQTGVSFLLQGQQGSAPDTVGGMQLLHQNSSALLRRIARIADEYITIPHITRYYEWLLLYGEDDEKGDLTIEALGSSALVEREIQVMQLPQILQLSLDPRYEKSPKRVFNEILKAWKFTPERFDMDEEEKEKLQQMAQQPQQLPQVMAAQINAQAGLQKEQMRLQFDAQKEQIRQQMEATKMRIDTDRDAVFSQSVAHRNQIAEQKAEAELQFRIQELQLKRELAMLEYASKNELKLADVKAELASTAMKLNATRELVQMHAKADHLPTPPVEPPQRATEGHSFTE